jgi:hypothetical protein
MKTEKEDYQMSKWIDIRVKNAVAFNDEEIIKNADTIKCGVGFIGFLYTGDGGINVVRYSGTGREKFCQTIRKDGKWRIGAERMYRVIPPEEENDPFKKILREANVPIKNLIFLGTEEPLETMVCWQNLNCYTNSGPRSNHLLSDSQIKIISEVGWKGTGHSYGVNRTVSVSQYSTVTVEVYYEVYRGCIMGPSIGRVWVRPNTNPDRLKDLILVGLVKAVDKNRWIEADREIAAKEIGLKNFSKGLPTWEEFWKGLRVSEAAWGYHKNGIFGRFFSIMGLPVGEYADKTKPTEDIIKNARKWGWGVVIGEGSPIPKTGRELFEAVLNREAAKTYLAKRYVRKLSSSLSSSNPDNGSYPIYQGEKWIIVETSDGGIGWQPLRDIDFICRAHAGIVDDIPFGK